MITFLMMILKIIGIIFCVILGLLTLIVCIILFVPFCYEAWGQCMGTRASLKLKGHVHWLFRFISMDAYYKNNKYKVRIRIAWKKLIKGQQIKEKELKNEEKTSDEEDEMTEEDLNTLLDLAIDEKKSDIVEKEESSQDISEKKDPVSDKSKVNENDADLSELQKEDAQANTDEKKENKKKVNAFEKIKYTFEKSCDKIKDVLEKKNKVMDVLTEDSHIQAVLKMKKELFHLLKKLKPQKCSAQLVFGFEDPKNTGEILALLSVLYPILGDEFNVTPDFSHQTLRGKIHITGKVRICYLVGVLVRLLLNKNVRKTYKDIKAFEL